MSNKPTKVYAKYAVESEGRDVHGRFATAYNEASKGKALLLAQCVAGGWLLRECGLLSLTTEICESEEYLAATSTSQRRELLLNELLKLSGIGREAPTMPLAATVEAHAPTPAQEQQIEPIEPHSDQTDLEPEAEEPAPTGRPRPVMRSPAVLPDLGATSSKK